MQVRRYAISSSRVIVSDSKSLNVAVSDQARGGQEGSERVGADQMKIEIILEFLVALPSH